MAAPIIGKIHYYSGVSGTVSLEKGERMLGLWCLASGAGGKVVVDGGSDITLVAGVPFAFGTESRAEEWVGPVDIVFTNTATYFIKTKRKVGG